MGVILRAVYYIKIKEFYIPENMQKYQLVNYHSLSCRFPTAT
jgi:hypothetical protein